jgi:hypothetical protein
MSTSPVSLDIQIGTIEKSLRGFIEKNDRKTAELAARTLLLEQHITSPGPGGPGAGFGMFDKSIGHKSSSLTASLRCAKAREAQERLT